jgi:hypothetical protein
LSRVEALALKPETLTSLGIAKPAQRRIKGVVAYRTTERIDRRKHVLALPGHLAEDDDPQLANSFRYCFTSYLPVLGHGKPNRPT